LFLHRCPAAIAKGDLARVYWVVGRGYIKKVKIGVCGVLLVLYVGFVIKKSLTSKEGQHKN
jgi:hypothetical protein